MKAISNKFFALRVLIAFLFFFLSCSNDKIVNTNDLTFEEARSSQFISFEIGGRFIHLTEFKNDSWPFGTIVFTENINFDTMITNPVSRSIYASVPEEMVLNNHIETFGIEFNNIFPLEEIEVNSNKLLSHKNFVSNFLEVGEQDINLSNFGFHQTYLIGIGIDHDHSLRIDNIQNISDKNNAILIVGEFSGSIGQEYIGEITNGKFKLILQN